MSPSGGNARRGGGFICYSALGLSQGQLSHPPWSDIRATFRAPILCRSQCRGNEMERDREECNLETTWDRGDRSPLSNTRNTHIAHLRRTIALVTKLYVLEPSDRQRG